MGSHPEYQAGTTKNATYHGVNIEIKGNHDLMNSPNYKLEISADAEKNEERASSGHKPLPAVPNPAKKP